MECPNKSNIIIYTSSINFQQLLVELILIINIIMKLIDFCDKFDQDVSKQPSSPPEVTAPSAKSTHPVRLHNQVDSSRH